MTLIPLIGVMLDVVSLFLQEKEPATYFERPSADGYYSFVIHQVGIYLPCYDIFRNLMEDFTTRNAPILTPYVPLVAGSVARSLACVTCYPVELARTRMQVYICNFIFP